MFTFCLYSIENRTGKTTAKRAVSCCSVNYTTKCPHSQFVCKITGCSYCTNPPCVAQSGCEARTVPQTVLASQKFPLKQPPRLFLHAAIFAPDCATPTPLIVGLVPRPTNCSLTRQLPPISHHGNPTHYAKLTPLHVYNLLSKKREGSIPKRGKPTRSKKECSRRKIIRQIGK
jgi:hypothetical protein